ncbi:MAG: hypothetical protein JNM68_17105 [Dinghuibacter sp.]|nr:hypothetical protein [Dinghuibacter sp.]
MKNKSLQQLMQKASLQQTETQSEEIVFLNEVETLSLKGGQSAACGCNGCNGVNQVQQEFADAILL